MLVWVSCLKISVYLIVLAWVSCFNIVFIWCVDLKEQLVCRREGVRRACRAVHLSFCVRTTELCVHVLCVTPFTLCQNDRVVCACALCHTFHSVSERPSYVCMCCVTPFTLCQNDRVMCACAVCRSFHSAMLEQHWELCVRVPRFSVAGSVDCSGCACPVRRSTSIDIYM